MDPRPSVAFIALLVRHMTRHMTRHTTRHSTRYSTRDNTRVAFPAVGTLKCILFQSKEKGY